MTVPEDGERRRANRVKARVKVNSSSEAEPLCMETLDVSASGTYCLVDRFVPLMSKVSVTLEIPTENGPARRVRADAIVVRAEPDDQAFGGKPGYRLALFFSRIEGDGKAVLEDFVGSFGVREREI